jgi:hypothetical protein
MVLSDDEFVQPAHDFQRGRHLIKTKDTHTPDTGQKQDTQQKTQDKTRRKTVVHKTRGKTQWRAAQTQGTTEDKTQVSQEEGIENRPLRFQKCQ